LQGGTPVVKLDVSGDDWRWMLPPAAVLAGVMFFYPLLLDIPLLDPDEGLLAAIAQEMVQRGDYLTPRLFGEPFLDKPIFFTWARVVSLRLFGASEAAIRFPGLMFGFLGAVTTGIVAWRMFGRPAGILAGMFYATLILPTALAQAAMCDVALVPWVSLAVLGFWELERTATRRAAATYTLGIGALLGLAVLTKGLLGVALVGVAYGSYLLITRRPSSAVCLRGAAALAVAAVVASPWYIVMEVCNPGYNYYYFVERHFLGYTTSTQFHGSQPWWYYLPILAGGGLPWIAYLPVTAQDGWIRRKAEGGKGKAEGGRRKAEGAMTLLWCWLIGCTLFLSVAHSKLVTYIWPVFPPVAILAAVAWVRLIEGTLTEAARRSLARTFRLSCLFGPVVLPLVMVVVQSEFAVRFSWPVWLIAVLAAAGASAPLGFWIAGRFRAAVSAAMLSVAVQFAVIMAVVFPHVAAAASGRDLADHFNRLGRLPPRLLLLEERIGSLVFYLDRDLRATLTEGQLQYVRAEAVGSRQWAVGSRQWAVGSRQWAVGSRRSGVSDFPPTAYCLLPTDVVVALPERKVYRAVRHLDLTDMAYKSVGRWRLYKAMELESRARGKAEGGRGRAERGPSFPLGGYPLSPFPLRP